MNKEFKALDDIGMAGLFLGQRRNFDRIIINKGRLNQESFTFLLKEEIHDIALAHGVLEILKLVLNGELPRFFDIFDLIKIDAAGFFDGVIHAEAAERRRQIEITAVIADFQRSVDFLAGRGDQVFGHIHHAVIIRIGLIELDHRELWIVTNVNALVAEIAADFVHALQTADNQAFQIKLRRDAQKEIHVESIVVSYKGTRRRSAGNDVEQRGFHFNVIQLIQLPAENGNNLRALDKGVLDGRIHNEIQITLAIARICVLQAVEFFGQRTQGFGQQLVSPVADGNFSALGTENFSRHFDQIADVEILPGFIALFAQLVDLAENLNAPRAVLQVDKAHFAHAAFAHDAPGHADRLAFIGVKIFADLAAVGVLRAFCDCKRELTRGLKGQ